MFTNTNVFGTWYVGHVKEVERLMDMLLSLKQKNDPDAEAASISISTMVQSLLVRTQEIGDQKLGVIQQIQDILENKTSQLDLDQKKSGIGKLLFFLLNNLIVDNQVIFLIRVCFKMKNSQSENSAICN